MKLLASLLGLGVSKLSPFSDDILYTLDFVGEKANLDQPGIQYDETDYVIMKTPHNEEYKCYLPQDKMDADDEPVDIGQYAEDLLDPFMKVGANNKPNCTPVKLETYWSYELCHGKFVRQYHEEKIKNGVSKTEYYLGYYNGKLPLAKPAEQPKSRKDVKTKMIDGIETAYFEMEFDSGTECSLKQGTQRTAKVQYICNPQALTAEVLSITETRTCEYEVQVLTSALCKSPLYAQKIDTDTFGIPCEKIGDITPIVPLHYQPVAKDNIAKAIMKEVKKTQATVQEKTISAKEVKETIQSTKVEQALKKPSAVMDAETKKILHAFLQGDYCLRGGTGWWKYEFCYGKHVMQYHDWPHEAGKPKRERDEIVVGKWVPENHSTYAATKNVVKRSGQGSAKPTGQQAKSEPKTTVDADGQPISEWNPDEPDAAGDSGRVMSVELFYTDGDVCDITGMPRDVIVRLKCKPGATSLSLYLLEPKTCSYILGLESQLLCQLLTEVDEQGLIQL